MMALYLSGVLIYGLLAVVVAVPLGALAANGMTGFLLTLLAVPPRQTSNCRPRR